MIDHIIVLIPLFALLFYSIRFSKYYLLNRRKFNCPMDKIIDEKYMSTHSAKQIWYKKRNYCINKCSNPCSDRVLYKKMYFELVRIKDLLQKNK